MPGAVLGWMENRECLFNQGRVSVLKMKGILEMDGGDVCTTM